MTTALTILTVCTGNLCRSPFAEAALRAGLSPSFSVASAGTFAVDGDPAPQQAIDVATARGLDLSTHRARYLTSPLVVGADLVLAMGREHRRAAVEHSPAAIRRAFTILEFARLTDSLGDDEFREAVAGATSPAESLAAILRLVASQRGALAPVDPARDDVVDPYGRGDAIYAQMAASLDPAVASVVRALSFVG